MLRALSRAGVRPDLIVGTSIGAVNGAFVAADPDGAAERLDGLWCGESLGAVFSENVLGRAIRLARSGTHLHAIEPLRRLLADTLPARGKRVHRPPAAVSLRRRLHRGRDGPLVQQRPAGRGRHGVVRRAWPAAPGRDRRRGTTSTAASSTRSRSAARSRSARASSTCCTSAGSRARFPSRPGPGRWASSRSRSPAGTASTRRCRHCRQASRSTCCPPAASGSLPVCASSVTGARIR